MVMVFGKLQLSIKALVFRKLSGILKQFINLIFFMLLNLSMDITISLLSLFIIVIIFVSLFDNIDIFSILSNKLCIDSCRVSSWIIIFFKDKSMIK